MSNGHITTIIKTNIDDVSLEDLEQALEYVKRMEEDMVQRKNRLARTWYSKRRQEYEKAIAERVLLGDNDEC